MGRKAVVMKITQETFMKVTKETKQIERLIDEHYPNCPKNMPRAYRYSSVSIRVRVVDEQFKGKGRAERERMVLPLIRSLPEETQEDINILLVLAPDELDNSLMNREYEHPAESEP